MVSKPCVLDVREVWSVPGGQGRFACSSSRLHCHLATPKTVPDPPLRPFLPRGHLDTAGCVSRGGEFTTPGQVRTARPSKRGMLRGYGGHNGLDGCGYGSEKLGKVGSGTNGGRVESKTLARRGRWTHPFLCVCHIPTLAYPLPSSGRSSPKCSFPVEERPAASRP
eukprot:scaffold240_cov369-Pavlova_lutheri.AAC.18